MKHALTILSLVAGSIVIAACGGSGGGGTTTAGASTSDSRTGYLRAEDSTRANAALQHENSTYQEINAAIPACNAQAAKLTKTETPKRAVACHVREASRMVEVSAALEQAFATLPHRGNARSQCKAALADYDAYLHRNVQTWQVALDRWKAWSNGDFETGKTAATAYEAADKVRNELGERTMAAAKQCYTKADRDAAHGGETTTN